jgi:anhydro-N-acetylmuramic acid kinase
MSGTSLDGIDAALVGIEGGRLELQAFHTRPYTDAERAALLDVVGGAASVREVALLHRRLGTWFAEAARQVLDVAGVAPDRLEFVASHGQTVWHEPGTATLQIGCAHTIAEQLGVRVVSDFRSRDVAAGGQGAPLVPLADAMLFGHPDHPRALLNIGGMANVTWVPRLGSTDGVIAFDTGPGVAVVDAVARMVDPTAPFDQDGRRAARGAVRQEVLEALLALPYFQQPPPKSTGRETFGAAFAEQLVAAVRESDPSADADDLVATALAFTVASIADQFIRWLPDKTGRDLVVSGGGARNPVLLERLAATLDGWTVARFDDLFFDGDAKEAATFAYLGWRALLGEPGNVPAATGADGPRVLGSVTL